MIKKDYRNYLKVKIIVGFVLSVAAVIGAGIITLNALNNLDETTRRLSAPREKLTIFRDIIYELSAAESAVRTYTISKEEKELSKYFASLFEVERKLDTLQLLSLGDKEDMETLDTLSVLLDKKITIYSEIIELRKSVNDASNMDIIREIESDLQERVTYRKEIIEVPVEEEKESVFGKLKKFFTDEEESPPTATKDTITVKVRTPSGGVSSSKVREIIYASQLQKEEQENANKRELALLEADLALMEQVKGLLYNLQSREAAQTEQLATEARSKTKKTLKILMAISVVMVIALIIFLALIFHDITLSNKYRAELLEARSHAEKLARLKEQLLANMSHEIRTPLNAILGFSEQLSLTPLNEDQKSYLNALQRSSDLLLHTVNDILHFSKLEAGKLKIEEIPFKMEEILTDTISTVKDQAEKKGIEVSYTLSDKLKQIFVGDPYRLKQILINLTSNGIKFTEEGTVSINVDIERDSPDEIFVRFRVQDTGIGITKDKLATIFEEFNQADTSVTRKFGGTGLGLTIVKKLVELQNGTIELNSEPGKGSEFIVILPFRRARKTTVMPGSREIKIDPKVLEGKKVLLVDDDEMNQLLGKTILMKWNVDLDQALTGKEALQKIRENPYDIVLMDIQMPEMSGMDVTRAVRKLSTPFSEVPILAVTANVIKSDIESYMEAGMDDYLLKPYNEKDLYRKITDALNLNSNGQEQKEEDLPASYNLQDLHTLANNDTEFMLKFLETFIKEAEKGTNTMMELIRENRFEDLPSIAHKLIPSMVHVGADNVVPVLRSIEKFRAGETDAKEIPGLVMKAVEMINHVLQLIYSEVEKLKGESDKNGKSEE